MMQFLYLAARSALNPCEMRINYWTLLVLVVGLLFHTVGLRGQSDFLPGVEDSLQQVIDAPTNDTADYLAMYALVRELIWTNKPRARLYIDDWLARSIVRENERWHANALRVMGNWQMTSGNYDSALYYNSLAIQKLENADGNKDLLIMSYLNSGVFFQAKSEYEDALTQYTLAYNQAKSSNQDEYLGKILNNLGIVFRRIGRPVQALKYYREAIAIKETAKDSLGIANSLANLGKLEMELGQPEASTLSIGRAKKLYLALGDTSEATSVDIMLGSAYYQIDSFERAKSIIETALASPGLKLDLQSIVYAYLAMSDINLRLGNLELGLSYWKDGSEYAAQYNNPRAIADFHRIGGQIYAQIGQADSATYYLAKFAGSADTISTLERQMAASTVSEKFETQLKEAEIDRQQLVIEKQQQSQKLLWLGITSLAFGLVVIYLLLRYRLRLQRSEAREAKLLREQELRKLKQEAELNNLRSMIEGQEAERRRVAKDLHDGLGGLLSTVKARVSSEVEISVESGRLLDRACTEVRRIAHNMMPQTLSLSGLTGAIEDICAQLQLRGFDCELEISGQPDLRLDEGSQSMLLRIVQELTHNAAKHAQAEKIFIQLLDQPNQLLLTVEDDGIGFNPQLALVNEKTLGLSSIQNRVDFLKGTILYDSSPGHGTTVNLTIPL